MYDASIATHGNFKGQLGFLTGDRIIIAAMDTSQNLDKILAVLVWDPDTEDFVLKLT